jgi:pseudouridine kinase
MIDRKYELDAPAAAGSSNPARLVISHGGVARNVAETLARLGARVDFVAALGEDAAGAEIRAALEGIGVGTAGCIATPGAPTAEYAAILDWPGRDLIVAAVAMGPAEAALAGAIGPILEAADEADFVFADANLPREAIATLLARRAGARWRLAFDAVSVAKARRLPARIEGIDLLFCNADEARAVTGLATGARGDLAAALRALGAGAAIVTGGREGVDAAFAGGTAHVPAIAAAPVDVTGAGDALIGATLWRLGLGEALATALRHGVLAAGLTVESAKSVRPDLSPDFLAANLWRIATA